MNCVVSRVLTTCRWQCSSTILINFLKIRPHQTEIEGDFNLHGFHSIQKVDKSTRLHIMRRALSKRVCHVFSLMEETVLKLS